MTLNSIDTKPVLRISKYHCARSDDFAEFPLRLERTLRGQYYWAMAQRGEFHWWPLVNCNDEAKTGETTPA